MKRKIQKAVILDHNKSVIQVIPMTQKVPENATLIDVDDQKYIDFVTQCKELDLSPNQIVTEAVIQEKRQNKEKENKKQENTNKFTYILEEGIEDPMYQTEGASGIDLPSGIDFTLKAGEFGLIKTGITVVSLPTNCEAQVRPRSGLALKYGITVLNSVGTIDNDYRGEIGVILINHGKKDFIIKKTIE